MTPEIKPEINKKLSRRNFLKIIGAIFVLGIPAISDLVRSFVKNKQGYAEDLFKSKSITSNEVFKNEYREKIRSQISEIGVNFQPEHFDWVNSKNWFYDQTEAKYKPSTSEVVDFLIGMGVKNVRMGVFIDQIYDESGDLINDFPNISRYRVWMEEFRSKGIKVNISFGIKSPRWPEMHISDEMLIKIYGGKNKLPEKGSILSRNDPLVLQMKECRKKVYAAFKEYSDVIDIIQPENEPLNVFGKHGWIVSETVLLDELLETHRFFPDKKILYNASDTVRGQFTQLAVLMINAQDRVASLRDKLVLGINLYCFNPDSKILGNSLDFDTVVASQTSTDSAVARLFLNNHTSDLSNLKKAKIPLIITEVQFEPWYGNDPNNAESREVGNKVYTAYMLIMRALKLFPGTRFRMDIWGTEELIRHKFNSWSSEHQKIYDLIRDINKGL